MQPREPSYQEDSYSSVIGAIPDLNSTQPDPRYASSPSPVDVPDSTLNPANQQLLDILCNFLYSFMVQVQNNGKNSAPDPPSSSTEPEPSGIESESSVFGEDSSAENPSNGGSSLKDSFTENSESHSEISSSQESNDSESDTSKSASESSASISSQISSPSSPSMGNSADPYEEATARPCKYTVPYDFSNDYPYNPDYYYEDASMPSSDSSITGNNGSDQKESLSSGFSKASSVQTSSVASSVSENAPSLSSKKDESSPRSLKPPASTASVSARLNDSKIEASVSSPQTSRIQPSVASSFLQESVSPSDILENCTFDSNGAVMKPNGDCGKSCSGSKNLNSFKNNDGSMSCCCV